MYFKFMKKRRTPYMIDFRGYIEKIEMFGYQDRT